MCLRDWQDKKFEFYSQIYQIQFSENAFWFLGSFSAKDNYYETSGT